MRNRRNKQPIRKPELGPGRVKGQEVEETKQPKRKPELGPARVKG